MPAAATDRATATQGGPMRRTRIARKVLFGAAYVLCLLATVVVVDYVCHWSYYHELEQRRRPTQEIAETAGVPMETLRHVGLIRVDKATSFPNVPRIKPKG